MSCSCVACKNVITGGDFGFGWFKMEIEILNFQDNVAQGGYLFFAVVKCVKKCDTRKPTLKTMVIFDYFLNGINVTNH